MHLPARSIAAKKTTRPGRTRGRGWRAIGDPAEGRCPVLRCVDGRGGGGGKPTRHARRARRFCAMRHARRGRRFWSHRARMSHATTVPYSVEVIGPGYVRNANNIGIFEIFAGACREWFRCRKPARQRSRGRLAGRSAGVVFARIWREGVKGKCPNSCAFCRAERPKC